MNRIGTAYLDRITDDFGIWQHTNGNAIDKSKGYSLDDSARGLLAALVWGRMDLAAVFLGFIETSFAGKNGPVNFFDSKRQPIEGPISPDAIGEAYWALSYAHREGFDTERASPLLEEARRHAESFRYLRSKSYAVLGAVGDSSALAEKLAEEIMQAYEADRSGGWDWFEDTLTYANAILPYALFAYASHTGSARALDIAVASLDFLNGVCKHEGVPMAIGNQGWYTRGGAKSLYSQQPIDPAYQVLANKLAAKVTKKDKYELEAEAYLSWFWGSNILGRPLIDPGDESCRDGIDETGLSKNKGSENIVCYLIAQAAYEDRFEY